MTIDGKAIANNILADVRSEINKRRITPHLTVFTCAPNFETQKFLALKQKRAREVGIEVEVVSLDPAIITVEAIRIIAATLHKTDAVVVQLPFPPAIDIATILQNIPATHDVDALQYEGEETEILPPVVGAIDAIAKLHKIQWSGKKVVVVGQGRLVGAPAALYAATKGAEVTALKKDTFDYEYFIKEADILILGVGMPCLVTADMIKDKVIVFDAGTSEEGGVLVGDAAPEVAKRALLITPVPGGIGPVTIAILLQNVLKLYLLHSKNS